MAHAFVLVAGKPGEPRERVEAYAYGTVQGILPLRVTYFGAPVYVWQMRDMLSAEVQADRLASGLYTALPFRSFLDVQTRVGEWSRDAQMTP